MKLNKSALYAVIIILSAGAASFLVYQNFIEGRSSHNRSVEKDSYEDAVDNASTSKSSTSEEKQSKKIVCPNCKGTGTARSVCDRCDYDYDCNKKPGGGYIRIAYGNPGNENCRECPKCSGTGYYTGTCTVCNGSGRVNEYE